MVRKYFFILSLLLFTSIVITALYIPAILWLLLFILPLFILGLYDIFQSKHTVLRNFPVIGHGRYFMEMVRPEIQQYFIDSNIDAFPIEREYRSVVYQRAKNELDTLPYGTQRDVYRTGYEWASHSIAAHAPLEDAPRIHIGGPDCTQPYDASLINISALSFGALSSNAIRALNRGAKIGGFAHNTGEGGISRYHLEHQGDLIWQIGTGYFGCRDNQGNFDEQQYTEYSRLKTVRMIEIKLSQGAKPGHGGVLPGVKVSEEIAQARGVPVHKTVVSPPYHSAFSTPVELMEFVQKLRELSQGKPIGIKLCIGRRTDFFSLCKAMLETGITPDFITIDGGEGGTGAAPVEFSNSIGMPARDAWIFAHSTLVGTGLRDQIKVITSGKIFTGFHAVRALALGADLCMSARGMMLALGCIQSLRCNTNHCPTGVATQDPELTYGLHVTDKAQRVANFQAGTIRSVLEIIGAMGLDHPDDLRPYHIFRRVDDLRVRHMGELYDYLENGQLLNDELIPDEMKDDWMKCSSSYWTLKEEKGPHGGDSLRED